MILFGILCLVIVGSSWALVGIIMGHAPKRGIDTGVLQFFGGLVPFTVSAVLFATGTVPTFTTSIANGLLAAGLYATTGLLNYVLLQLMAQAMQRGPNGIVWGIIQSGLIFPFAMGMVVFDVPPTIPRLAGMIALLGALALFAMAKNNAPASARGWLRLSFMAFLLCGATQMLNNLPSYIPEMREGVSYYFRSFALACGIIIGFVLFNFVLRRNTQCGKRLKANMTIPLFWKLVLAQQGFGLLSAYFLIYRGMDILSAAGIGSASYPLMVGSCVVAFTLYSAFVMKERHGRRQYVGLSLCVCGIILICI